MKSFHFLYFISLCSLASCLGSKQTQVQNQNGNNQQVQARKSPQPSASQEFVPKRKMAASHTVLDNGEALRVFLELDIPRLSQVDGRKKIAEQFIINYGILPDYTSKEFIETKRIVLSDSIFTKKDDRYYLYFDIPKKPIIRAVLVIDIVDTKTGQKILQDDLISYTTTKIRERYGVFEPNSNVPYFSRYLLQKNRIQIRDVKGSQKTLIARHFNHEFGPATPPMATVNKLPPKQISSDTAFTIQTNQYVQFPEKGLYLIQEDTSEFYGICVYVSDRKYPKLSKIDDLIDPLIYITTQEEIQQLKETEELEDTKRAMDLFWLKLMSGNINVAKQTIREYYRRVKMANKYFTSYKPGWQTDMGMIYIVYGSPNRIVRNNESEHWVYTQNASFSEIKFSFLRKPNQFVDDHYVLIRYPDYEQVWFPAIEMWREGKI